MLAADVFPYSSINRYTYSHPKTQTFRNALNNTDIGLVQQEPGDIVCGKFRFLQNFPHCLRNPCESKFKDLSSIHRI